MTLLRRLAFGGFSPHSLLTVAFVCGVMPMCCGLTILSLYYFEPSPALEAAGGLTIVAGVLLFFCGLAALMLGPWQKNAVVTLRQRYAARAAITLLAGNFPVALLCIVAASYFGNAYRVELTNESSATVTSIRISVPGEKSEEIASLAPGQSITRRYHFRSSAPVLVSCPMGSARNEHVLTEHAGFASGGSGEVRFLTGGGISTDHVEGSD